jgi:hypothetical protein
MLVIRVSAPPSGATANFDPAANPHHTTDGVKVRADVNNQPGKVVRFSHLSAVTASGATTDGYPLLPGEEVTLPGDPGKLYFCTDHSANQIVYVLQI